MVVNNDELSLKDQSWKYNTLVNAKHLCLILQLSAVGPVPMIWGIFVSNSVEMSHTAL